MMGCLIVCVVLVSCRHRCGVITPHQHRCDVIFTAHACWKDDQLFLCGIFAHAKSFVVHHRGLSAGVNVSQLTSKWNVPYLYIDWLAFPFPKNVLQFIAEIMHPIGYRKVMQDESYFFLIFLQPVPSHPYPAILVGNGSSVCVLC